MTEEEPTDLLVALEARLAEVEAQATRRDTWTLVGLLGVLAVAMLLSGADQLALGQAQHRAVTLLRVCAVGAARIPEAQVAYCEQAVGPGYRVARAKVAGQAVRVDSLERWAATAARGAWVPPPTTTLYPEPPQ